MGFPEIAVTAGGVDRWGLVTKLCDYCTVAQALLFCRTESAHMCISCDSKIHASHDSGAVHARVWMCEACEQAPASVTCKADAAALCAACDRGIHSANPLAQRHERLPVVPFYDTAESLMKSTASTLNIRACIARDREYFSEPLVSSFLSGSKESVEDSDNNSIEFLFSDMDNYPGFHYPISSEGQFQQQFCSAADGVVPVQSTVQNQLAVHSSEKHFEIDFTKSHVNPFHNTCAQSLSQNVSSSSLDIVEVPNGSSKSEILHLMGTSMGLGGSSSRNQGAQLAGGTDREARVLRYREKRKNRKFEKTIRYASRKAYAETRPRIKGRFAKRTDSDVDQMFGSDSIYDFFHEASYGVVPSF